MYSMQAQIAHHQYPIYMGQQFISMSPTPPLPGSISLSPWWLLEHYSVLSKPTSRGAVQTTAPAPTQDPYADLAFFFFGAGLTLMTLIVYMCVICLHPWVHDLMLMLLPVWRNPWPLVVSFTRAGWDAWVPSGLSRCCNSSQHGCWLQPMIRDP